jgi:hypothetical protein
MPTIKIYGERNTGTNYLQQLINKNLNVHILQGTAPYRIRKLQKFLPGKEWLVDLYFSQTFSKNLGWKHSLVKNTKKLNKYKITGKISFITLTKNPYSWLISLYRRPYHQYYTEKPDFETFLNSTWKTVQRENAQKVFNNPIELWNKKNRSYIILKQDLPTINLRYEDILRNPEEIIEQIKNKFNLYTKKDRFNNIVESTKKDQTNYFFYKKYYLNEDWRKNLSDNCIKIINKNIDKNLLEYYNYKKIDAKIY